MKTYWLPLLIFCVHAVVRAEEPAKPIDWQAISSPIIFQGGHKFAYRDPAVVYHNQTFHLYFTLSEGGEDGGYSNMTAYSKSRDLIHWTYPCIFTPHPRDRKFGYSSPGNVVRFDNRWVLCLQTYPSSPMPKDGARIWILRSDDLEHWSAPELLAVKGPGTPVGEMGRMIDPYLIEDAGEPGKWWCFYKQKGVSMSWSRDLKNWTYVGSRPAGENVTILRHNDKYVMFHSPGNGIGVKVSPNLSEWGDDEQLLLLGQEKWPWAQHRLTAATVVDLTGEPRVGKFVMFFHGATVEGAKKDKHGTSVKGSRKDGSAHGGAHGAASLALAWSDDLRNWTWPGKANENP